MTVLSKGVNRSARRHGARRSDFITRRAVIDLPVLDALRLVEHDHVGCNIS